MSKQLTATVSDDADLALTSIEIACRKATGQPIRRPEAVEIAILVAARLPGACAARRAAALEQLQEPADI